MMVSIIIPVYNGEKTIARAINSCMEQTYKNIEIIVIDNKSTDKTNKIVVDLKKKDDRIKLFYTDIRGRSNARNIGLKKSEGDYIQFLDADDELCIDKIFHSLNKIIRTDYFAHVSSIDYIDQKSNRKSIFTVNKIGYNDLLYCNYFPINSILFKNIGKVFFDSDLEYNEDWLFWIEMLKDRTLFFEPSYIGGKVYITGDNTMSSSEKMTQYEMLVRQKVKHRRTNFRIKNFIKEFKLFLIYQLIEEKNETIRLIVEEKSKYIYYSTYILIRSKHMRKIIEKRILTAKNKSVSY